MAITAQQLWAANRFEGSSPTAMQVEVVGVQFQWYFHYPGEDATFGSTKPQLVNAGAGNPLGLDPEDVQGNDDIVSSELVLPAGREVDLRLRAHDVIHGFFIPGMRLKQNAVPGLTLHVHFTPTTPGEYPILCTRSAASATDTWRPDSASCRKRNSMPGSMNATQAPRRTKPQTAVDHERGFRRWAQNRLTAVG